LASTKTEFKALKTKYQNEIDSLKTQIKSTERENFEKERIIQRLEINLSEKSEEIERVIRTH
jgi:peptidoglycan hydrolase CwlO-like protein